MREEDGMEEKRASVAGWRNEEILLLKEVGRAKKLRYFSLGGASGGH